MEGGHEKDSYSMRAPERHAAAPPAALLAGPAARPYATPELPGTGGVLRSEAADFAVEEVPLYAASGAGEHVYLTLEREGWSSHDLAVAIARHLEVETADVGFAGLKDRRARAVQTFSIRRHDLSADEAARRVEAELPARVLAATRHGNKIRRGHLLANRFSIRVRGVAAGAEERAHAVVAQLVRAGLANHFGEQRLGHRGEHVRRGWRELGGRKPSFAARFALSALQAALFDAWLDERIARGWLRRALVGDVAKLRRRGALFDVVDAQAEQARLDAGEIAVTGPIYGTRMRRPGGEPAELEAEILRRSGLTLDPFARSRLDGSRRAAVVWPEEVRIATEADGALRIAFTLPKGTFATTLLREVLNAPVETAEDVDEA